MTIIIIIVIISQSSTLTQNPSNPINAAGQVAKICVVIPYEIFWCVVYTKTTFMHTNDYCSTYYELINLSNLFEEGKDRKIEGKCNMYTKC